MSNCSFCGNPVIDTIEVLHITHLEATRIGLGEKMVVGIDNESFCDSDCFCRHLKELEWIAQHDRAAKAGCFE